MVEAAARDRRVELTLQSPRAQRLLAGMLAGAETLPIDRELKLLGTDASYEPRPEMLARSSA